MSSNNIDTSGDQFSRLQRKWALIYMLSNLWIAFCFAAMATIIRQVTPKSAVIFAQLSLVNILSCNILMFNTVLFVLGCCFIWRRRIKLKPTIADVNQALGTIFILHLGFFCLLLTQVIFMLGISLSPWPIAIAIGVIAMLWAWTAYRSRNPQRIVAGYRFSEIEDDPTIQPLRDFAAARGVSNPRFALLELSAGCDEAVNIYKPTGKGPMFCFSRPVLEMLTAEELKAAFAHELAHHELRHVGKTQIIKLAAVLPLIGLFFAMYLLFPRITLDLPYMAPPPYVLQSAQVVPYFILACLTLTYLARPIAMALSRRQETQANAWALQATGNPAAFISAMNKLATNNHATGRPSLLQKAFFATHPPLADVIQQAKDYAAAENISPAAPFRKCGPPPDPYGG